LFTIWVVFHVIVCIGLILVVLLQSSKGEGLAGSAFGGGGLSGAVFGGRGAATFLSKATSILAIVFMLNCIALAYMSASSKNITLGGAADDSGVPGSSVVTEKAQEERERALQLQQQQQVDTTAGTIDLNNLTGGDTTGTAPVDPSGN